MFEPDVYKVLSVQKDQDLAHGCSRCGFMGGAFLCDVFFPTDNKGAGRNYFKWLCSNCIVGDVPTERR